MSTNIIDGTLQLLWRAIDSYPYNHKYDILSSDDDLTSSNNKTKQKDLVSDEHGVRDYW